MVSRVGTVNLSNMPSVSEHAIEPNDVVSEELNALIAGSNGWKVTNFEPTPVMSTYIVAFANGEFEYLETLVKMPLSEKTIPLRIYSKSPRTRLQISSFRSLSHSF